MGHPSPNWPVWLTVKVSSCFKYKMYSTLWSIYMKSSSYEWISFQILTLAKVKCCVTTCWTFMSLENYKGNPKLGGQKYFWWLVNLFLISNLFDDVTRAKFSWQKDIIQFYFRYCHLLQNCWGQKIVSHKTKSHFCHKKTPVGWMYRV